MDDVKGQARILRAYQRQEGRATPVIPRRVYQRQEERAAPVIPRLDPDAECPFCHTGDETGLLDNGAHWTCVELVRRREEALEAEEQARKATLERQKKALARRRKALETVGALLVWLFRQSPAVVVALGMALVLIVPQMVGWWAGLVMDAVGGTVGVFTSEMPSMEDAFQEGRASVQP